MDRGRGRREEGVAPLVWVSGGVDDGRISA